MLLALGRIEEVQVGFGNLAGALGIDVAVDDGNRRLGEDRDCGGMTMSNLSAPNSSIARYASFSHASSTSPISRWAKVVVEPRAPVSRTGTCLNKLPI
jgi:hypothetical protein